MQIAQSPYANFKAIFCLLALIFMPAAGANAASKAEQIAVLKAQRNEAVFQVQHIVNQPVTHLKRTPDMRVSVSSPGWFHAGAVTPVFDHVDIRTTRQLLYENDPYVTSDLNPGEVFRGPELEFNPMTKYFYTDRSVPKKKLTEAEMLQINDLYRVIGRIDTQLDDLLDPVPPWDGIHRKITAHKPAAVSIAVGLLLMLVWLRRRRAEA